MAATVKKTGSKKSKRNVPNGVVHIQSTFNNTSGFKINKTQLTLEGSCPSCN